MIYAPIEISGNRGCYRDKAKGIIAKPMPRSWYDKHVLSDIQDETEREHCYDIMAYRKPYFMRYIYPDLMREYNTYITNTKKNCLRRFRVDVQELIDKGMDNLTDEESEFLHFYNQLNPVGMNSCVMNRICRRFENEFDHFLSKTKPEHQADYSFMRGDSEYHTMRKNIIRSMYNEYSSRLKAFSRSRDKRRHNEDSDTMGRAMLIMEYKAMCHAVCSDSKTLCDIILDVCYEKNNSKQFAWDICAEQIIENLLEKNNYEISYPVEDENGDVFYRGKRYTFVKKIYGEAV